MQELKLRLDLNFGANLSFVNRKDAYMPIAI
jgi:hypothetical protein